MRKPFLILLLLALALSLAACKRGEEGAPAEGHSASLLKNFVSVISRVAGREVYWTTERADAARTGWLPLKPVREAPVLLWEYEAKGWKPFEPVEGPGFVAFGSEDALFVLNSKTGKYYYNYGFTGLFDSSPTVHGDRFLFGTIAAPAEDKNQGLSEEDTFFYCLGVETQSIVWQIQTPWVKTAAAVEGNTAVFNTFTISAPQLPDARKNIETWDSIDKIYAVNVATGALVWDFPTVPALYSPAARDGRVYAPSAETLYGLDLKTGAPIFQVSDGFLLISHPVAGDKAVYIITAPPDGTNLYALHPKEGRVLWKLLEPGRISGRTLTLAGDLLVYAVRAGKDEWSLAARDAATGAERWRVPAAAGERIVSLAGAGDALYAGSLLKDKTSRITALDRQSGGQLWSLDGGKFEDPAVAAGDGVIYVKMGRKVRAYGPAAGRKP